MKWKGFEPLSQYCLLPFCCSCLLGYLIPVGEILIVFSTLKLSCKSPYLAILFKMKGYNTFEISQFSTKQDCSSEFFSIGHNLFQLFALQSFVVDLAILC